MEGGGSGYDSVAGNQILRKQWVGVILVVGTSDILRRPALNQRVLCRRSILQDLLLCVEGLGLMGSQRELGYLTVTGLRFSVSTQNQNFTVAFESSPIKACWPGDVW